MLDEGFDGFDTVGTKLMVSTFGGPVEPVPEVRYESQDGGTEKDNVFDLVAWQTDPFVESVGSMPVNDPRAGFGVLAEFAALPEAGTVPQIDLTEAAPELSEPPVLEGRAAALFDVEGNDRSHREPQFESDR